MNQKIEGEEDSVKKLAEAELVNKLEQSDSFWMRVISRIFPFAGFGQGNSVDVYVACKDFASFQNVLIGYEQGYMGVFFAFAIKKDFRQIESEFDPTTLDVDQAQLNSARKYFQGWPYKFSLKLLYTHF